MTCIVNDCSNKAHARQMCAKHYQHDRAVRNGERQCRRKACTLLAVFDGLCKPHWRRRLRADEENELRSRRRCSVEECPRPYAVKGFCQLHYARQANKGDPGPAGLLRAPNGTGFTSANGYRWVSQGGHKILEHRFVMETWLGRALWPDENVHHKNGDRADNRLENLELWSTTQPSGQRVADKVAWAREVLARYEHLPPEIT